MSSRVIVGSKNPVKINAVKESFQRIFPDKEFTFKGISVDSGVGDQPIGDKVTLKGANNRADHAQEKEPKAQYWVGMEGGVRRRETEMHAFAWIVIKSNNQESKAKTATFQLSPKIVELINQGKELGEADDIVFGKTNSKQKNGAVGLLTNNVETRTTYYIQATTLALIPFLNEDLY